MIRTLVALSLIASAAVAVAGSSGAPNGAPAPRAQSAVAVPDGGPNTKEVLSETYSVSGNGEGTSLPQFAFTTVGQSRVKCNHAHGCSIGIESMGQIMPQGGDWAICLLVDGNSVSCQYQGIQGSTTGYAVGNARGWATAVPQGTHTVTTQLYAEGAGAVYAYFQTEARIYTP